MSNGFTLPGLSGAARSPIEAFTGLGFVEDRKLFSQLQTTPTSPLIEAQEMLDGFDAQCADVPILNEIPRQAAEAVGLILADMCSTFKNGSYVLRFLFRQGDVAYSPDSDFDLPHVDLEGNCLATYIVSDEDPTLARVNGGRESGEAYQIVRMRGDVPHYRPRKVSKTRTTVIGNISDTPTFNAINGGGFAHIARVSGILKPISYPTTGS